MFYGNIEGPEPVRGTANLIPQSFARDDGNLIADTLVGLEVEGQSWVITFDDDFSRFFDRLRASVSAKLHILEFKTRRFYLCTNATHVGGVGGWVINGRPPNLMGD